MEKLDTTDGQLFIKNLASFVRTHEKALANALQLKRQPTKNGQTTQSGSSSGSTSSTLASALSFGALKFTSQSVKPAKLTLTPHHLFYLLSRFEDISIAVGPMNVRLENIHNDVSQSYVSFLSKPQRSKGDRDSIHSVSSVRSVMSGMSSLWSSFGLGSKDSSSKSERAKAALEVDIKYLYSAFTKIPCLRLAPDRRARLIRGYEEFPFDTAVPLHSFKNLSALEIIDIDYRSFYGWDRLSEQLRTLTLKRANIEDPAELLTGIVLDDIDKRRRRSSKHQSSPVLGWSGNTNAQPVGRHELSGSLSAPGSPVADTTLGSSTSPQAASMIRLASEGAKPRPRAGSLSPSRPGGSKQSTYRHSRTHSSRIQRTGSGSSNSSENSGYRTGSSSNLLATALPSTKWRFLRHLGLADNSLTSVSEAGLIPVANTLHSLDLSTNLFTEVPDSLASLIALRALNLSNCMIESLHSLSRNPLPAITALNLRANRLRSLAGIERLLSLERLDLRDNKLSDPTEIARLTSLPEIREIWVSGNPFVKTHSNYRVVIFNLFRRTPGYSEDIIIDGSGPGYSERKQLVERAAEPDVIPVIRSTAADNSTLISKPSILPAAGGPITRTGQDVDVTRIEHLANDNGVGSTRKKKSHRRRIVDPSGALSVNGDRDTGAVVPSVLPTQDLQLPVDPSFSSPSDNEWKSDGGPQAGSLNLPSTGAANRNQDVSDTPGNDMLALQQMLQGFEWGMDADFQKHQIAALQQELGSTFLAALQNHAWNQPQMNAAVPRTGTNISESTRLSPESLTRANSQPLVGARHPIT
ncbi:leucine-rich repeat domain-containing protein [Aspergillus puulaauensis]|uniref:Leucine rich repeat domain protein n=1 Tax=Aspergillus puulaauensis TaxID=1220207 RepID=A0A7R7XCD4_9EURO|nr:uncharacterized protein APUU_11654A [Aspergillus puulaauensis]BCS18826.1 hypothetical protein APUU_11654A [Aspergillus puulaauensis]